MISSRRKQVAIEPKSQNQAKKESRAKVEQNSFLMLIPSYLIMQAVFTWLSYKTTASYNDNGNTRKFILNVDT